MKKLLVLSAIVLLFSCKSKELRPEEDFSYETETTEKSPVDLGKELFEGKGNCYACHQLDQKIIGPSVVEIAKIYKEKNGNIVKFLKEEADPIVDPAQYEAMKVNFAITKTMTDTELQALEAYIYGAIK